MAKCVAIATGARAAWLAGLAIILSTDAALAAGAPGPVALPAEVIGVVGSGDKLSLRIKAGDETRLLNIGDTYADGWALTGLSNTTATLTRNGQNQTVGLNPSGAIAQARADDPATTVNVVGLAELAQLQARQIALGQLLKEQLGPWDGKTPRLGLTLEETQRYVAYQSRGKQAEGHKDPLGRAGFLTVDQVSSLGADRLDYMTLNQKLLRGLFNGSGFTPLMYSVSRVPADEVNSLVAGRASTQDNVQMAQDVLAGSFAAIISAPPEDLSTIKLIQSQGDLSLSVGRLNFPLSAAAIAASGGL